MTLVIDTGKDIPTMRQSFGMSVRLIGIGLFLVLVAFLLACEEREVPFVVDEDEILRYINTTEVGIELFGTKNLIGEEPFTLSDDPGATYHVQVDSVTKTVLIDVTAENAGKRFDVDFLPPPSSINGWRDAEVEVVTQVRIQLIRITGSDTSRSAHTISFKRYGWFLKLSGDNRPYLGWHMEGYNSGGPFSPTLCSLLVTPDYRVPVPPGDSFPTNQISYTLYSGGVSVGSGLTKVG